MIEFAELLTDKRLNACVIGPGAGLGDRTRDFVLTALSAKRGLVLDADALTSFAEAPDRLFEAIKASHDPQVVLTPHEGEFPRLFSDISNKHPNRSKLERVQGRRRTLRRRRPAQGAGYGGGVAGWTRHHRRQRAALACHRRRRRRAGGNDRRACWRRACRPSRPPRIGVWMHGEAAREAGPGLIAEDLPEVLPAVFRHLYDEFGIEY